MFENLEPLDSDKHKDLRFTQAGNFSFAAGLSSSPLSATEVVEACKCFPVVFPNDGPLLPLAILSLKEGVNAFVDAAGEWLAPYVPVHVRRYPFILGDTDTPENFAVMIDRAAPHFAAMDGEPLFTGEGVKGPDLAKALELLKAFQEEVTATQKLLAPLAETGVLTMQRLDIEKADGAKASIEGVRAVDQKKMMELDDSTLAGWVRSGLMVLINAHLGSLRNLATLADRQGMVKESGPEIMGEPSLTA